MSELGHIDFAVLEVFFGAYGKVLAAGAALLVALISLAIWIFKIWHAQTLERILSRGALEVQQKDAALRLAAAGLVAQKEEIRQREKRLEEVRSAFSGKEHDLWCMRAPRKPSDYDIRIIRQRKKPIIMVANLKGGVGKTTLAANLAAYFSGSGKRVLLVNVDYQGSLSNMLLSADGVEQVPGGINDYSLRNLTLQLLNEWFTNLPMSCRGQQLYRRGMIWRRLRTDY